jgi:hypothetical protein
MRSGDTNEHQARAKHPLLDWLDNAARVAAAQNAGKHELKTPRETADENSALPAIASARPLGGRD